MKVGIAIKPKTPSTVLYPYIPKVDMALVMVTPWVRWILTLDR